MMQQNGYKLNEYKTWLKKKLPKTAGNKKPLNYTPRVKRLFVTTILSNIILFPLLLFPAYGVYVGAWLNQPLEEAIKNHYLNDAKRKLKKRNDLMKIGITGSFGKTSAKFFLHTILCEKFSVCTSPESFNTPMGLTRVVREHLQEHHQILIAEMGARYVGDIGELCDLIHPTIGIVTALGPQHLETFGSMENLINTKYELIDSLPQDGLAVLNFENQYCKTFADRTKTKVLSFGFHEGCDIYAKDITVTSIGSRFILCAGDEEITCKTKLLGKHNVLNILSASAVAHHLGLTLQEIARGIAKIEAVPHRLQILPTGNGITVIDDAFNSNPEGARVALEVLSSFEGRKIIITPGMIELGQREREENFLFGKNCAAVVDIALLIGKNRTAPIYEGLIRGGFDSNNIVVLNNLEEATAHLATLTRVGDVVLFENDLPDSYSE